ncbi:PQQ-binding-like beta-propeller repeat protein [Neobacillus mesonae]|uniref:outer membrane protein assembly factor BamB family protein n=1 Tax=Neobacillus mesonae TaxID=1193713 RepID=UPI00203D5F79|nr:PQQ-binding-like beta-propeller repeat protein [Neobacillus mesonae]MCM3567190.1 PQQ-binding-like beta-propeller repeat protein [Neobacillus mesonae]
MKLKRYIKTFSISFLAVMLIVGCQTNNKEKQDTAEKKTTEVKKDTGFPIWGYDYQQTRHVPYKEITKDNVKDLGIVWQSDLATWGKKVQNASEDYPVVKDGVMYVTTSFNRVFAINASNGKKIWDWQPPKEVQDHLDNADLSLLEVVASRGVAVAEGNVFVLIADNRLAKLDAKTGKLVKMINFWDVDSMKGVTLENRYYETSAPMYYKGNVYVGSSGGDNGIRGFVMAFKASDLSPAWDQPFWTVPEQGKDWVKGKFIGGGAVWNPMSFDPDTDMMYFGVGNPAPDFFIKARPGKNPYTDSVVALDSKTGKLIWAKSEVENDEWDYDAAATPMVLNANVGGSKRKIVVHGGKNGKWFAWDAKTGETIYDGVPFVKIKHSPLTTDEKTSVPQWPGVEGGENYAPETYDPTTNYVLIPGINAPSIGVAAKDEKELEEKNGLFPGTAVVITPKGEEINGTITAIDVNTGKKVYQNKTKQPMRGGFTSTASGLAFYGELDGTVNAMDVKTGKVLWNAKSGGEQIMMAPSIYVENGKQYVVFVTGTKVVAFGLGGKLSATPEKSPQGSGKNDDSNEGSHGNKEKPKKQTANINAEAVYNKSCISCHGQNLEGGAGPSLKHVGSSMSQEEIEKQIINGGGRMPGGLVDADQAKALAKWLANKK